MLRFINNDRGDPSVEERLNRVKQQLQQSSYKLTPQREATLRVLIENEKMPQC